MKTVYDAIIIGLGGMGSATAYNLALKGKKVLGLEQFGLAHDLGSSHGNSRIIRQAYWEGTDYVPMLLRAYELWNQIQLDSGKPLLQITGGIFLGQENSRVVKGSITSAEKYNIPHKILSSKDISTLFPPFKVREDYVALYEEQAGILAPELAISAFLNQAAKLGAHIHFNEPVEDFKILSAGNSVDVITAKDTYSASRLIITAGPWTERLLAEVGVFLKVQRTLMHWFQPKSAINQFGKGSFPIFLYEEDDGTILYGVPADNPSIDGVKISFHNRQAQPCNLNTITRQVKPEEIQEIRTHFRCFLPSLNGKHLRSKTCMYTMSPDEHFIIDRHPQYDQIVFATGFSGHGYKFASVIGEILAEIASDGATRHNINHFSLSRFLRSVP